MGTVPAEAEADAPNKPELDSEAPEPAEALAEELEMVWSWLAGWL
jgi:hypothetical protein